MRKSVDVIILAIIALSFMSNMFVWAADRDVVDDKRAAVDEARDKAKEDPAQKRSDKWWNLRLSTALQYDDNAVFRPDDDRAVTDNQDKEDWKSITTLNLKLTPLRKEKWQGGFNYSLYKSFHAHTEEYELLGNTLGTFLTFQSPKLIIHTQYSFSYFHLENEGYLRMQDISPTFVWVQRDNLIGIYRPFYRDLDYLDDSLGRDGYDLGISLDEWIMFGAQKQFRISIGYTYTDEEVDDDSYSYTMHEGRVGFNSPLWWGMVFDFQISYQNYDYDERSTIYNVDRTDTRWTTSAGISKRFGTQKNMVLELLLTRIVNNSTIGAEEYERHLATLTFSIEW